MSHQIFDTIDHLRLGNLRQQSAYETLTGNSIMQILAGYDPILTGTVPINIDIEHSDLDIICCYTDADDFISTINANFETMKGFKLSNSKSQDSIIANFYADEWEIEIFGQPIPTRMQNAYRHMVIEHKLLQLHGNALMHKIIELKKSGYKTEPAFAEVLGLQGDPYQALLDMVI